MTVDPHGVREEATEEVSQMNTKPYLIISGIVFALGATGHGLRLGFQWPIKLNVWSVPLWASGVAVVIMLILFIWAFLLARK
jgi:hypothetical protein